MPSGDRGANWNEKIRGEAVKKFLKYAWWIGECVIQLAIILFVFSHLTGGTETVVVAILGLLYVTTRSMAIGQGVALAHFALAADREFIQIREMLGEDHGVIQERVEANKRHESKVITGNTVITGIFLALVGVICLVVLLKNIT
jgi:hypothetical protein